MKENLLKYGLLLLSVFFYCTNAMSIECGLSIEGEVCNGGGETNDDEGKSFNFIYNENGDYFLVDVGASFCLRHDETFVCGDVDNPCPCRYDIIRIPIGNGMLLLLLLALSYVCVVYYRRQRVFAVVKFE